MKEKKRNQRNPDVAPGMDDSEELERKATRKEVEHGESTEVTTFSYDEVEPS